MATSNTKSPIVIRQGVVVPWRNNVEIGNTGVNSLVLQWELSNLNIVPISYTYSGGKLQIYFYKWTQLPFRSKVSLRQIISIKNGVKNSSTLLRLRSDGRRKGVQKLFMQRRNRSLVEKMLLNQYTYSIPLSIQNAIAERVKYLGSGNFNQMYFFNIFSAANQLKFCPLEARNLIQESPLLKGNVRSIYHIVDMILIYDLLSLRICSGEVLGQLIGLILGRSTRKGLFIRSLRLLAKLPTIIRQFEIKNKINVDRDWEWIVKVSGKLGGMGRTKVFFIRPIKLPLHTISKVIKYNEVAVNTKAGTFSIKIWILN